MDEIKAYDPLIHQHSISLSSYPLKMSQNNLSCLGLHNAEFQQHYYNDPKEN